MLFSLQQGTLTQYIVDTLAIHNKRRNTGMCSGITCRRSRRCSRRTSVGNQSQKWYCMYGNCVQEGKLKTNLVVIFITVNPPTHPFVQPSLFTMDDGMG